ncbi:hypothetical protein QUA20_04195 [Microcoleus sp. Pol7_A1]|uniref:hypothetical protein n=1 Tax=Microcoleus sp. Pol7_A1 TaxID=2818893 RepID=UPI002FCFD5CE
MSDRGIELVVDRCSDAARIAATFARSHSCNSRTLDAIRLYVLAKFYNPEAIPFVGLGIVAQWLFLAFRLWKFLKIMRKLKAGI